MICPKNSTASSLTILRLVYSNRYNERWNLLLQRDVDAVVKQYKELAGPVSKDALDKFTGALADEYRQRQEVRLCICAPSPLAVTDAFCCTAKS